jgi:hypothetical protein
VTKRHTDPVKSRWKSAAQQEQPQVALVTGLEEAIKELKICV